QPRQVALVAREEHGTTAVGEALEERGQTVLSLEVEPVERLVQERQGPLQGDGEGQRQLLAHAAGVRAWELAQPALQPEALQQPQGALLGSRVAVKHGVQVGVLRQRQVLVEGRLIRYEHEALTARERSGWAPYDLDIAAGRH